MSEQAEVVSTATDEQGFTAYQWRLFAFLSVATFFEGFDMFALTQILPSLQEEWHLTKFQVGLLAGSTNVGTVLAYLLVRRADRWGRRRVMSVTIAGYTIASLLTAATQGPVSFAILQCIARVFLIGEWATAMVYAAEEFPASRRGTVVGIIQAVASLGAIVCAAIVPTLLKTDLKWRTIYLVGAVPLVIVAFARRTLRESARFEQAKSEGKAEARDFFAILRSPHKGRVLQLGLIWALTYVCTQNTVTFFKTFALEERSWTDKQVGSAVTIAAIASLPMLFLVGRMLDRIGRRRGALVVYGSLIVGCLGAFGLASRSAVIASLVLAVFAQSAVLALLNAYTGELFPTELRGDAFAWSNNLLGRIGYVTSPVALGALAEKIGWGKAVESTTIFAFGALVLLWLWLPETKGRELEDTARVH
ncbi:MAG: MFS transporter [Myxococcales bacterium]|nr:MFS transporter [Myxococcales bacterium]